MFIRPWRQVQFSTRTIFVTKSFFKVWVTATHCNQLKTLVTLDTRQIQRKRPNCMQNCEIKILTGSPVRIRTQCLNLNLPIASYNWDWRYLCYAILNQKCWGFRKFAFFFISVKFHHKYLPNTTKIFAPNNVSRSCITFNVKFWHRRWRDKYSTLKQYLNRGELGLTQKSSGSVNIWYLNTNYRSGRPFKYGSGRIRILPRHM
jgi:hypothetical protein